MFKKLWVRFSGIFLVFVVLIALGMSYLLGSVIRDRFTAFLENENQTQGTIVLASAIENYYARNGSFEGLNDYFKYVGLNQGPGGGGGGAANQQNPPDEPGAGVIIIPPAEGEGVPDDNLIDDRIRNYRGDLLQNAKILVVDTEGLVIIGHGQSKAGDILDLANYSGATPLYYQSSVFGYLILENPLTLALSTAQTQFIQGLNRAMILILFSVGALAVFFGAILSRAFTRPLEQIGGAAKKVAQGELGYQVEIRPQSAAEFVELGDSFNTMSTSLYTAEEQRRRMTADVAHELRTPLAVMRAQLQSMMDEVRQPSIENIAIVYDENLHLSRLVEDLRTLTLAESGHLLLELKTVSPGALVERAYDLFEPLAEDEGITLRKEIRKPLLPISADPTRIQQVMANLIVNALRYSEPGGDVLIRVESFNDRAEFTVSNSGVTLTPEAAKHIFERFWRADESRARDKGGAGLGLSISRQMIRLHGGDIRAEVEDDRTIFTFTIPTLNQEATKPHKIN